MRNLNSVRILIHLFKFLGTCVAVLGRGVALDVEFGACVVVAVDVGVKYKAGQG